MVRVGIAGLGFIGRMHLGTLRRLAGVKVVAVADCDPARLQSGSAGGSGNIEVTGDLSLEGVRRYDDAETLLNDPGVDAVLLSLPTYLHKRFVLQAIASGKHILCEKPMALTVQECAEIRQALQGYDRCFLVGHCIRFWPAYSEARRICSEGRFGAVRSAHFVRNSPKPDWSWNNWILDSSKSGGALLDLHIHDVDFANHLLGEPDAVEACGVHDDREGIGQVNALYRYRNGACVSIDGGWNYPPGFPFRMAFRIQLDNATLEFNSLVGADLHLYTQDAKNETILLPAEDGYHLQWKYFIDCIERNLTPAIVTPESSIAAISLVERERQAIAAPRA